MPDPQRREKPSAPELPTINQMLMRGFRVFNRRYLNKHFHTLAIQRSSLEDLELTTEDSLVVYANHASWWDPLVALYLAEQIFPEFRMYAPIDAEAFEKYRMFGQMGFFPVQQNERKGATHFLKTSRHILEQPGTSIWLTPEGRFADVRDDTADLMPGLAHLAHAIESRREKKEADRDSKKNGRPTATRTWFIPVAVEYTFWEERLPEILAKFGEPIVIEPAAEQTESNDPSTEDATRSRRIAAGRSKNEWNTALTSALRQTQRELASDSIARRADEFEILLRSQSGTFFLYDWWRSLRSRMRGESFQADHSEKLNS